MVSARDCALPGFTGREEEGDADRGERHRGEAGGVERQRNRAARLSQPHPPRGRPENIICQTVSSIDLLKGGKKSILFSVNMS